MNESALRAGHAGGVDAAVDAAGEVEMVAVAEVDELWDGEMEAFDVDGDPVLVVKLDGEFHAYHGICPHQSVELVEGTLEGHVLTCRAHEWSYDVRSGVGVNPSSSCLAIHRVQVADDQVLVSRRPITPARH